MALDLQAPNYSGLATLAGKSAPLNIQSPGALGLQALQQGQANEASLREDAARRMALQQQGQLGLLSNHTQNRALDIQAAQQAQQTKMAQAGLNLDQQKMAMQQGQFADELGMKSQQMSMQDSQFNQELELKNRMLAEDTAKRQMAELINGKKEDLQSKGAFASYGLISMSQAKTSEEKAQIKAEILKEAKAKKYMSPEELKTAAQMPISQFENGLKYKIMQYGQGAEYKSMMDASKPAKSASNGGVDIQMDAEGNVTGVSIGPTNANKTKAQDTVNDRSLALTQLGELASNFDPSKFTNRGRLNNTLSVAAENSVGTPVIEGLTDKAAQYMTGQNAEDRAKNVEEFTNYMNTVEQFFNQTYKQPMTGAAVGEDELKKLKQSYVSGDLSPSQFKGALNQLIKKFVGEKEFNENFLKQGTDVTPNKSNYGPGWSQERNDFLLKNGITQDQIDQQYKVK